jgi:probable selenium-dependent hydroxylase accessory protein YqeC
VNFGFVEPWHLFLPREAGHVISLMGSGGKTSLLQVFADVYREVAMPVVLTTTTMSEPVPGLELVELAELDQRDSAGLPDVFFLHGGRTSDGKLAGLPPETVDELGGLLPDRIVLVEVDGAAKLPVKLHRKGEPVWPARTSLAIVVMGTAAVGSRTAEILHRFSRVDWPPLADLEAWTVWEWDHALTLLLEPGGYLSRVPEGIPCVLALTGMEEQPDSIGLFDFVGRAMENSRLPLTMFCDLAADQPVIRTAGNRESGEA